MTVAWQVAGLALLAGVLLVIAVFILIDNRMTPERKEKMRRSLLSRRGRLVDGVVTEVSESTVYYSYLISGVAYTASQDVSQLSSFLPAEPERLIGPVWLKYSMQNPANSIVLSEEWSGLRKLPVKEPVT